MGELVLGPRAAGSPGRRPAVGRLLGTSWPFPGEGTHPTSEGQQLTDMRVPRGQGTPGGRGPGWPLAAPRRAGCRTPGTRLQPRPRKRCTQEPDSPPPGRERRTHRAPHLLLVTTSLLRNARGHVAQATRRQRVAAAHPRPAPAQPVQRRAPPPSPADLLGAPGGGDAPRSRPGPRGTWRRHADAERLRFP